MENILHASHLFTIDQYILLAETHRFQFNSWIVRWGRAFIAYVFLGIGVMVLAVLPFAHAPDKPVPAAIYLISAGFTLAAGYSLWWGRVGRYRSLRRSFRKFELRDMKVVWTFTPEWFATKSPISEGKNVWSLLHKVVETSDGFVLYYAGGVTFNWIPKHAFEEPFGEVAFAELAAAKVKAYKRLSMPARVRRLANVGLNG